MVGECEVLEEKLFPLTYIEVHVHPASENLVRSSLCLTECRYSLFAIRHI